MSRFYAHLNSLWLLLPIFSSIFNQLFIADKFGLAFDEKLFSAIISGTARSLLLPLIFCYIICRAFAKQTPAHKLALLVLFLASLLPLLDTLYFNATYSRFHWSILHDFNFYAIRPLLFSFFSVPLHIIVSLIIALSGFCLFKNIREKDFLFSNCNSAINYRVICGLILLCFFFPVEYHRAETNFTPKVKRVNALNQYLNVIAKGAASGFFLMPETKVGVVRPKLGYSEKEFDKLRSWGLIPAHHDLANKSSSPHFQKVILLVFESMALEYLHSANSSIPPEASSFFDALMAKHPSSLNFRTSDSPTINGLYAKLNARIPFAREVVKKRGEKSIARLFSEKYQAPAFFIRGISKFYGQENTLLKEILGFTHLITYEELEKDFPAPPYSSWGFHDDIVFAKTLQVIEKHSNTPVFILTKLFDQHQPPYYCGLPATELPKSIAQHPSPIVKSIYWANYLLKNFFAALEKQQLLDDQTLIIITADHYPPLGYGHKDLVTQNDNNQLGRIPLIFVSKKEKLFEQFDKNKMACQIDLAPTIAHLTGISPSPHFLGQNLVNKNAISRTIGHFNDQINIEIEDQPVIKINLHKKGSPEDILDKWINNLFAR